MGKLWERPTDRPLTDYEKAYGCFLFTPCDAPGCDNYADALGDVNYCYDHSGWYWTQRIDAMKEAAANAEP